MNNTYFFMVLNALAGLFLVSAQIAYIRKLLKKEITPSAITWLGWSLLVGIALVSQWQEMGWNWSLVGHFFSATGCGFIFVFTLLSKNYVIRSNDWVYLVLGLGCVIVYLSSSDALLTTLFTILADAIIGIPTILKAIKDPATEKTSGWNISMICWSLTLVTCIGNDLIFWLFPTYCLLFNGTMSVLTRNRRIQKRNVVAFG